MAAEKVRAGARVRYRVSLVLTLVDDFSNKVIAGSGFRVWIPGEKPPVRKPEGYYIFTNLQGPEAQVFIEAGLYESRAVTAELGGVPYTSIKVRLTPNRNYPMPRDTTCVEGRAEPGSLIRILCPEDSRPLKLIYDYERGGEKDGLQISLYHPENGDIEGKVLYITNENTGSEFFRVLQRTGKNGDYALEESLSADYRKIGTTVLLAAGGRADDEGAFFLPIPNVTGVTNRFLCEAVGKETTIRLERRFKTGAVNHLDFTGGGE